jgi:hypothetical protein
MPIWAYSTSMGELKNIDDGIQTAHRVVAALKTTSRLILERVLAELRRSRCIYRRLGS